MHEFGLDVSRFLTTNGIRHRETERGLEIDTGDRGLHVFADRVADSLGRAGADHHVRTMLQIGLDRQFGTPRGMNPQYQAVVLDHDHRQETIAEREVRVPHALLVKFEPRL